MGWFITAIVVVVLAVIAFGIAGAFARNASKAEKGFGYDYEDLRLAKIISIWAGVIMLALSALFVMFSTVYTQGVGEAKVIVNLDGTVAGQDIDPGFGSKWPWQDTVDFDLFSQEVVYAGNSDGSPDYSGGSVNGQEVSTSVANGARANLDISIVYSLDAAAVESLYRDFRSQERFTKQVIEKTILSTVRDIPTAYSAVEFRGEKRGEATDKMLKALNSKLNEWGVSVDFVNLQNVRYTEDVENALKQVEVAEQLAKKAEAELKATEISAQQKVVQAQAEADANAILNASLSEAILQQRYLDTLAKLAADGNLVVVPEGFNGLVNVGQ